MKSNKILFIYGRTSRSDCAEKDGGADYLFNLSQRLSNIGLDVHILTAEGKSQIDNKVKIHSINENWLKKDNIIRVFKSFAKFVSTLQPDHVVIIHPDGKKPDINSGFLAAILLGKGYQLHVILFFLGFRKKSMANLILLIGIFYKCKSLIFSDPDTQIRFPFTSLSKKKGYFLPVGSNIEADEQQGDINFQTVLDQTGNTYIAYFGYIGHEKGTDLLVKAFSKTLKYHPEYKLLIICGLHGNEYEKYIKNEIDSLGISTKVIWTGYCPPNTSKALLQRAQFVVLPYRATVIGRSSLAAALIANGAVLTTKPTQEWDKFSHGNNIYLTTSASLTDLHEAMNLLLSNPDIIKKLKEESKTLAKEFDWNSIANNLVKIISPPPA